MGFYDAIRIGASGAADSAYQIDHSLRFVRGDAHKLTRTPGSAGNRRTWTWSAWIKTTGDTGENFLFSVVNSGYSGNSEYTTINLYGNKLRLSQATNHIRQANKLFRDPSAWYHIVVKYDSTDSTADDRAILYSNGERLTDLSNNISISENYETAINTTLNHTIGDGISSQAFNGLMAEVNFLDGYAYDPSYFGETNAITGQWVPKEYTGSYGSQGFYLKFADNSSVSALGTDSSGNGNNWTPNAAIVVGDRLKDTPTNNFPTLQMMGTPFSSGASFYDVNLQLTTGSSGSARNLNRQAFAPMLVNSGKWYAEFMQKGSDGYNFIGVGPYQVNISTTANNTRYAYLLTLNGEVYKRTAGSETNTTHGSSVSQYDVIGVYLNMDAGTPVVYFSKNGQWADGSGNFDESSPTSAVTLGDSFLTTDTGSNDGFATFILSSASGGSSVQIHANFGQDSTFAGQTTAGGNTDENGFGDFKYAVPTGVKALCSANLPDPTILLPNKHFDTLLYTGNGATSARAITGLDFAPDWIWLKNREASYHHQGHDTVRGTSGGVLYPNEAQVEDATYSLASFDNNGFSIAKDANQGGQNANGNGYVAWNWNAGETDGKTYTVTVVDDSGNKYRFDGYGTSAVTLDLAEGGTYIFNYPSGHPFKFSTTADGTHGGGSEYTTGVTHNSSTQVTIIVAASAPTLYYYCSSHSGMGGQVNTNSTLGSSNFDGNLQSVTKVNATAGFSIVKWTSGANTYKTVGHGLGVKPDIVIVKSRSVATSWFVFYDVVDGTNDYLQLNYNVTALNAQDYSIVPPTSSVFGTDGAFVGGATNATMIAYVFSSVAGYSKFGSYRGNGSTDGTFVYTGFRPSFILWKPATQASTDWVILDNKRDTFNVADAYLLANENNAEGDLDLMDFLSNGFKLRQVSGNNESGQTIIYLAFAEAPFKYARAR